MTWENSTISSIGSSHFPGDCRSQKLIWKYKKACQMANFKTIHRLRAGRISSRRHSHGQERSDGCSTFHENGVQTHFRRFLRVCGCNLLMIPSISKHLLMPYTIPQHSLPPAETHDPSYSRKDRNRCQKIVDRRWMQPYALRRLSATSFGCL